MYSVTSCSGLIATSTAMPSGREQLRVGSMSRARADARDPRRRAEQRARDLARDHVDLVAVGERDDDVGVAARRRASSTSGCDALPTTVRMSRRSCRSRSTSSFDIDDRDFVGFFARQVIGRRAADLAGAEDDDLHRRSVYRVAYISSRFA